MKLLNLTPLLVTMAAGKKEDAGKCDNFTGMQYQQCIRGRNSGMQFSGWIGPMDYDGVKLVAVGADVGSFNEVLPGPTLGCTVFQPAKGWGYGDWQSICQLINTVGGLNTDCTYFDADWNGGLCNNYEMILSYENWGIGESTGPDIWAHSSTWTEHTAPTCGSYNPPCTFPSNDNNPDCAAVAHTWSVMVYACSDFASSAKTQPPTTTITCGAQSTIHAPYVCTNLVDLVYSNLGKSRSAWDAYMGHGCNCPALDGGQNFGGSGMDTIDGHCITWTQCASKGSGSYSLEFDGSNYICTGGDTAKCECDMAAINSISSASVTTPVVAVQNDCQVIETLSISTPTEMMDKCTATSAAGLSNHGCWCQYAAGGAPLRGKPLSDLDTLCSHLSKCIKCNGECDADYSASAMDTGSCSTVVCNVGGNTACQEANCECIKLFAVELENYLSTNTIDTNLNAVDPNQCVRAYPPVAGSC